MLLNAVAAMQNRIICRSLEVICKYVQIDPEMVTVQLEQKDGDISILELNVTLPEAEELK